MTTSGLKRGIRTFRVVEKNGLLYEVDTGVLSMADENKNDVPVVSPTGKPVIGQVFVIAGTILAAIAGTLMILPVPPIVHTIAGGVLAVLTALGIASPGVRNPNVAPRPMGTKDDP